MYTSSNLFMLARVAFSFIISILVLDVGSGWLLRQVVPFGDSYVDSKNPLGRRGWYDYTMPKEDNSDYLIIVITNSQGYSPIEQQNNLYTDLLEDQLNENSDKTYRVLNWAMPGGRVAAFSIGLTRLIDHDPDLVIISSHGESFYIHKAQPIQYYRNDIVRLGYQFPYRQFLSDEFIERHSINDPLWFILHNTHLGEIHQFVQDGLDWTRLQDAPNLDPREIYQKYVWEDVGFWYVRELFAIYDRVTHFEVPLLMISMPVNANKRRNVRYKPMEEFGGVLQDLRPEQDNLYVVDAIDALDYGYFYDGTHYYAEGHQAYANYLYELLNKLPILENAK